MNREERAMELLRRITVHIQQAHPTTPPDAVAFKSTPDKFYCVLCGETLINIEG